MKHALKQIFYMPLVMALGIGVIGCTSNGYNSDEECQREIDEKMKEAEENKKKAEQSKQAIKELEQQKSNLEFHNLQLYKEDSKLRDKLYVETHKIAGKSDDKRIAARCTSCNISMGMNFDDFFEIARVFDINYKNCWYKIDPRTNKVVEGNFLYIGCPFCKTGGDTKVIQDMINNNKAITTELENKIIKEKSNVQQVEDAYTASQSSAEKLKSRLSKTNKEREGRLKAESQIAEMEKAIQAEKERKQQAKERKQQAKERKQQDKINKVKQLLSKKVSIDIIMMTMSLSREEIDKISIENGPF
jgi:hypothetical protein